MEDVIGRRTDPRQFERFLANWESILQRRVVEATEAFAAIPGVRGIILAGSLGRGEPWPLSDIDLLPIYDEREMDETRDEVERRRLAILQRWPEEGWWTGLDVGRLVFEVDEVRSALDPSGPDPATLLKDDRWYHSLDKGYRGRPIDDPDGLAAPLADWFTSHRFDPTVVQLRLERDWQEVAAAKNRAVAAAESRNPLDATRAIRLAVQWVQNGLLESWGERDNSFGRVGTRFMRIARARGQADLADTLNALADLDAESVARRLTAAPDWVRERHDRSWRARQHVGEEVTRLQDARDVLRVCSHYELRRSTSLPVPDWLAVPAEIEPVIGKLACLDALCSLLRDKEMR